MKLKSAEIINYRNLKRVFIKFTDNKIILITGDTGEGKSSIVEAIVYALTNTLKTKIEKCVRWGCDCFIINIHFEHANKDFKLSIKGEKGASKELIVNDDIKNPIRNSAVDQYIKENILNPVITLYSCVALQGESSSILFENSTPRLEKLKQIFGIDRINIIVENIKNDIKLNETEIQKLIAEKEALSNLKFDLEIEPDFDEDKYNSSKIVFAQLEKDKEVFNREKLLYIQYTKDLDSYNEAQKSIKNCEAQNITFKNDLEGYKEKLIVAEPYNEEEYKELIEKEKQISSQYEIVLRNISLNTEKNKKLGELQDRFNSQNFKREIRCNITEEHLMLAEDEISDLNYQIKDITKKIEFAQKGLCPTCGTKFEYDIVDLMEELTKVNNEKSEAENNYKKMTDELDLLHDIREYNEKIKIIRDEIQKQIDELNSIEYTILSDNEIKALERESLSIADKIKILEFMQKTYIQSMKTNETIQKKISEIESNILVNEMNIEFNRKIQKPAEFIFSVKFDDDQYEKIKSLIEHLEKVKNELIRIRQYNEKVKNDRNKTYILIGEKESKIESLRRKSTLKSGAQKIIEKEFSAYLIDQGSLYIKEKMNEFFKQAYGKYIIDFKQTENGKGIDFFYSEDGSHFAEVIQASGYEKEVLAIAFRKALNSLQNLGILFVDEIDSFASDTRSNQLFQSLLDDNDYNQIFIISHNESTKHLIESEYDSMILNVKKGEIL